LSTDKAVYPINAMGISKAMAEKILIAKSRSQATDGTVYCATRYGNVMGSRGSVIPLFISQMKSGMPVTVTDPNMTRFLMSLEDSVNLVITAYSHGEQGDILVQKSPACKLGDLVTAISSLIGNTSSVDIIGTRHGEKLYETLISREELARAEDLGDYLRIRPDTRDLNYSKFFNQGNQSISRTEDFTSHNADRLDLGSLKKLLQELDFAND